MVRLVFRHFAADERFARRSRNEPSPEIPLTLPFSGIFRGFFRVLLLLKPLSRSRSVAGVNVCVRVCVCECACCVLCACGKTVKTTRNREKCVWYGVCVVWCCEVRKCEKTQEITGKLSKHGLLFSRKRSKLAIFPNALFLHFPWDLPTILARGPNPNAKKALFRPRS